MNLLQLKVFFLSPLLLYILSTSAQESAFEAMVDGLISDHVPVLRVKELQTIPNIILLYTRTKAGINGIAEVVFEVLLRNQIFVLL